tara:strand:- start:3232 stop:3543 length:312 start_codon:yes stop_codon:yes gene_type:complete
MDGPRLTESSFGDYMLSRLKSCHENRVKIYSYALNIGIFLLFITIIGTVLYYRYKEQPTPYEKQQKLYRDQQYILDRIRYYQVQQKNLMTSPIGNLTSPLGNL